MAKRQAVVKVNEAYAQVFKYKNLEWTLAALYRRGYALERFAQTIIDTPIPPDVKRLGDEAVAFVDGTHLHPGDSFTPPAGPLEVLFLPTGAPWLKVAEAVDKVTPDAAQRARNRAKVGELVDKVTPDSAKK